MSVLVAFIASVGWLSAAAQNSEATVTPSKQDTAADGLEAAVARVFFAPSLDEARVFSLEVRIGQFDSGEHASHAITPWFDQVRDPGAGYRYDLSRLAPVAVEQVADETRAMIGTAFYLEDESISREVAVLAVRDGRLLYTFVAWGQYSSPIDEVIDVSMRTLGLLAPEFPPVPDIPYETGPLWDLAPRIEHVPEGLSWREDYVPCVGVFGAVPCPDPASTPEATPVTTVPEAASYGWAADSSARSRLSASNRPRMTSSSTVTGVSPSGQP